MKTKTCQNIRKRFILQEVTDFKKAILILIVFIPFSLYSQWVKKANFPDSRILTTAFSIGNYGYVGGGILDKKDVRDFWKYDPETDVWEPIDSIPVARKIAEGNSFVLNGKAYVCNINQLWEYDPETGIWTRKADTPKHNSVFGFSMTCFSIGNYGYLFAGNDLYPGGASNDFYQYDPETDTWTEKATCPVNKIIAMAGFSIKGKGYIGTGLPKYSEDNHEFWEYDPELDQWSRIADFPGASRIGAVAFSTDNYGFVGSGQKTQEIIEGTVSASDFWRYVPETDSWEQIDSCGYNASGAFSFSINGKGYVGNGGQLEFWEYSPLVNSVDLHNFKEFSVYPNPAKIQFTISNPSNIQIKRIELIDFSGRIVQMWYAHEVTGNTLNIQHISPGIYLLKAETDAGIKTEKLVVQ